MFDNRSVASLKKGKKKKTKHEKANGEWPEKEKPIAQYIYFYTYSINAFIEDNRYPDSYLLI